MSNWTRVIITRGYIQNLNYIFLINIYLIKTVGYVYKIHASKWTRDYIQNLNYIFLINIYLIKTNGQMSTWMRVFYTRGYM
jgi:hypothetical protein